MSDERAPTSVSGTEAEESDADEGSTWEPTAESDSEVVVAVSEEGESDEPRGLVVKLPQKKVKRRLGPAVRVKRRVVTRPKSVAKAKPKSPRLSGGVLCDQCNREYSTLKTLKAHLNAVHGQAPRSLCQLCPKSFCRPDKLNEHLRSVHGQERTYRCTLCSASFVSQARLTQHDKVSCFLSCFPFRRNSSTEMLPIVVR